MDSSKSATIPAKFKVDDFVQYTNAAGICWGRRRIIEAEHDEIRGWVYYIDPSETPWYGVPERHLELDTGFDEIPGAGTW